MKKSIFGIVLLFFIISVFSVIFVIYNYKLTVPKKQAQEKIIEITPECLNNEDCIPENPLIGVKYLCIEDKCETQALGNPASTNCQEKGGILKLRTDKNKRTYGVCIFRDESECEEWLFLREDCMPGDFNPNDNIWEGSVMGDSDGKYDNYFEMINGEKVGIASKNEDISNILNALKDKDNFIKVIGNIQDNANDYNKKQLNVTSIDDLGDITFNETTIEESQKIAEDSLKEDEQYIKDRGSKISLIEIKKIDCPYCWEFAFIYTTRKGIEKFTDVIIQEGEIRDISYIEEGLYKDCSEFALAKVCTEQYEPVCAKAEITLINNQTNEKKNLIEWQTFPNACKACIAQKDTKKVNWYKDGECEN
jgi:putative hemolysin